MFIKRVLSILAVLFAFTACKTKKEEKKGNDFVQIGSDTITLPKLSENLNGKQLSMIYCQKCHSYPDPSLLPKALWEKGVLPEMAFRMGITDNMNSRKTTFKELEILYKENVIPDKAMIGQKEWKKIEEFYLQNAPDSLIVESHPLVKNDLRIFKEIAPYFKSSLPINVTMLKYNTDSSVFYVGDSDDRINILNHEGKFLDTINSYGSPVDLHISGKTVYTLNIGNVNPNDLPIGNVKVVMHQKGFGTVGRKIIGDLRRPVAFTFEDLNTDGKEDVVISNFGFHTGSLSWYENKGNDVFEEHKLRSKPGAQNTFVRDLNKDGKMDILALMAQGDEGVFAYINKGNGRFEEETILRFPPVNGSNHMELVDVNKDGFEDLLVTNGDNADYSYTMKNYHGITIYLNDSKNGFKKSYFFPLPGASKALARDFDLDGDLDIAAIAFFPDFSKNAPTTSIYLENKGNMEFTPSTLKDPASGRWLTMEAADFDKDGDHDIVLGKYVTSPTPVPDSFHKKWVESSPYILILNNQVKKK